MESKLDGFQCELHVWNGNVEVFSRNQERTTDIFPDLTDSARRQLGPKTAILDGEAVAINESAGKLLPFQATVQRKHKHGIADITKEFPLTLFIFDVLYANGQDLTGRSYKARREILEQLLRRKGCLRAVDRVIAKTPTELRKFFDAQIEMGLEASWPSASIRHTRRARETSTGSS